MVPKGPLPERVCKVHYANYFSENYPTWSYFIIHRQFVWESPGHSTWNLLIIRREFVWGSPEHSVVGHTATICLRFCQRHSAWSQLTTHKQLNSTWSQSNLTKTDRINRKVDFSDETLYRSMLILVDFRKCWLHPCGFLFVFFAKNSVLSICSTPWYFSNDLAQSSDVEK